MSLLSRALLILAPRRRVRAAFRRHYERRDWLEPESYVGVDVVEELVTVNRLRHGAPRRWTSGRAEAGGDRQGGDG